MCVRLSCFDERCLARVCMRVAEGEGSRLVPRVAAGRMVQTLADRPAARWCYMCWDKFSDLGAIYTREHAAEALPHDRRIVPPADLLPPTYRHPAVNC